MKHKNRSYVDIIYLLTTFKQFHIYQKAEKIDYLKLEKDLKLLSEFNKNIVSDEMLKEFKDNIMATIDSLFGREMGPIKLKEFLKMINGKILTAIRSRLNDFKGIFTEIRYKENLIKKMIESIEEYSNRCTNAKSVITSDFKNKEQFLITVKNVLVKLYRGDLFLNNSSVELVNVLDKVLDHVYDPEGPCFGSQVIEKYGIPKVLDSIKFYINREEIQKTNLDDFLKFNQDDVKEDMSKFQVLPGKDIDSIIRFIKQTHQPRVDAKPDDPQSNSIGWSTLIFKLNTLTQRTKEIYQNNILIKVKETVNFPVDDLFLMVDKIEELYKIEDTTGDIDRYIKLLSLSMIAYEQYIELVVYDIYSYITSLEYINFIAQLTYSVCGKFLDDKKQNKSPEQEQEQEKEEDSDEEDDGDEVDDDVEDNEDQPKEESTEEPQEPSEGDSETKENNEEEGKPAGEGFFDWFRKKDDGDIIESSIRLEEDWEDDDEYSRIDSFYDIIAGEDKFDFHNYAYNWIKFTKDSVSEGEEIGDAIKQTKNNIEEAFEEASYRFKTMEKMINKTKNLKDKYKVPLNKLQDLKDLDSLEKEIKDNLEEAKKISPQYQEVADLYLKKFQIYKDKCSKLLKLILDNSTIIKKQ